MDVAQALAAIGEAARAGRWDDVVAAATAARVTLEAVVADDPELEFDVWIGEAESNQLAEVAAFAIDHSVDVAARVLDSVPDGALDRSRRGGDRDRPHLHGAGVVAGAGGDQSARVHPHAAPAIRPLHPVTR